MAGRDRREDGAADRDVGVEGCDGQWGVSGARGGFMAVKGARCAQAAAVWRATTSGRRG